MNLRNLLHDDEAVSPVIGVILMVAITVILAAVIGTFVLGQADNLNESAPSVQFEYNNNQPDNGDVQIVHAGGDDFDAGNVNVSTTSNGDLGTWGSSGTTINAGDSYTIETGNVNSGDTVRVLWASSEGGTSSEIGKYTVPS